MFAKTIALAATAAASLAAAPSFAQETETRSVEVSYAGLDLTNPAGIEAFRNRVKRAANAVCRVPGLRDLHEAAEANACIKMSLARAEDDMTVAINRARARVDLASGGAMKKVSR